MPKKTEYVWDVQTRMDPTSAKWKLIASQAKEKADEVQQSRIKSIKKYKGGKVFQISDVKGGHDMKFIGKFVDFVDRYQNYHMYKGIENDAVFVNHMFSFALFWDSTRVDVNNFKWRYLNNQLNFVNQIIPFFPDYHMRLYLDEDLENEYKKQANKSVIGEFLKRGNSSGAPIEIIVYRRKKDNQTNKPFHKMIGQTVRYASMRDNTVSTVLIRDAHSTMPNVETMGDHYWKQVWFETGKPYMIYHNYTYNPAHQNKNKGAYGGAWSARKTNANQKYILPDAHDLFKLLHQGRTKKIPYLNKIAYGTDERILSWYIEKVKSFRENFFYVPNMSIFHLLGTFPYPRSFYQPVKQVINGGKEDADIIQKHDDKGRFTREGGYSYNICVDDKCENTQLVEDMNASMPLVMAGNFYGESLLFDVRCELESAYQLYRDHGGVKKPSLLELFEFIRRRKHDPNASRLEYSVLKMLPEIEFIWEWHFYSPGDGVTIHTNALEMMTKFDIGYNTRCSFPSFFYNDLNKFYFDSMLKYGNLMTKMSPTVRNEMCDKDPQLKEIIEIVSGKQCGSS